MRFAYTHDRNRQLRAAGLGLLALLLAALVLIPGWAGADTIYAGNTRTVNISWGGQRVELYFTPSYSGNYTLSSSGSYDTYVSLRRWDASTVLDSNDDGGSSYNFSLTYNLSAGVTYVYEVRMWSSSQTGSFTVTMSGDPVEQIIDGGPIYAGGSRDVNINNPGTRVRFSFTPSYSGNYTLSSSGSYDTRAYLYVNGSSSYLASDDDSGTNRNFRLTYYLNAGTSYSYEVRMYSDSQTGSFTVNMSNDPVSQVIDGGTISDGQTRTVNINTAGTRVQYRFTPSSSGSYVITSSGSYDTYVTLYQYGSGTEIAHNDDGGSSNNFRLSRNLTAGVTYVYEVRMYSDSRTGSFTITLSAEGQEGGTISAGQTRTVNITYGGERVRYTFTPSYTGSYTLTSSGSNDTYVSLYQYGSSTELAHDDDSGSGNNFSLTRTLSGGTTYVYEVRMWSSGATGSFTIGLNTASQDDTISAGQTRTVNITYGGERVRYTFTPSYTGSYTLTSSGGYDTYASLYQYGSSTELAHNDDGGTNNNFSLTYTLNGGTTYVYEVRMWSSSTTGSFTIGLNTASQDDTISAGQTRTVNIGYAGQRVRLAFTPSYTGSYTLSSSGSYDTYASLYRSGSSTELAHNDDGGTNNNFSLTYTLNGGTTYVYEVRMWSSSTTGSFYVTLTEDTPVPNNQVVDGGSIYVGDNRSVTIGSGGARVQYRFTPSSSGTYTLSSSGSCDTRAALYLNGSSIATDDDSGSGYNFSLSASLTGGTTYVYEVWLFSSTATGNFTVSLYGSAPVPPGPGPDYGNATPTYWETKFRPGISSNADNNWRWQELDKLTDDNPSTYFQYYLYTSDTENGYPEFTAYFDNGTVSGIGVRNGTASGYTDFMRITGFHCLVYTNTGTYTVSNLTIPDSFQADYYWCNFPQTYTGVQRIEFYVDSRSRGNVTAYQYLIRIRDIKFR